MFSYKNCQRDKSGTHFSTGDKFGKKRQIDRFSLICKSPISMFTCTFDRCGFLLERNMIYGYNITSFDDNVIANSNIYFSKV